MLDILVWLGIGLLSGWIGQLATRTNEQQRSPAAYLLAGVAGSILGGIFGRTLDTTGATYYIVNTEGVLGAILLSPLAVIIYAWGRNFLGGASHPRH